MYRHFPRAGAVLSTHLARRLDLLAQDVPDGFALRASMGLPELSKRNPAIVRRQRPALVALVELQILFVGGTVIVASESGTALPPPILSISKAH
jgi:hypothetical protein